jgi:cell division protein FtsB
MKQSEKTLVGLLLLVGGAAIVALVGLPQWDAFSNNQAQVTSLNDEIKVLDAQKTALNAEIAQLEKNSIIPEDIEVQVYTEKNREQLIKGILDRVVNLATDAGNIFISLAPLENKNAAPEPPAPAKNERTPAASAGNASEESDAPPPPVLRQFSYELSVRGTYTSIQSFLRSMAAQKALIEIAAMKLVNEQGETLPSADNALDPFHPIRMTATIRLAMQPESR